MHHTSIIKLDRVARVPAKHALVFTRILEAPVSDVWQAISTKDGLSRWWIVPPTAFELRRGGPFHHHWHNTISDFADLHFIDIDEPSGRYQGTGGMRFEVSPIAENQTHFLFLATFGAEVIAADGAPQPDGPGTAWAAVAAGWHETADRLERLFNKDVPTQSETELAGFYAAYLRQQFRLIDTVERVAD